MIDDAFESLSDDRVVVRRFAAADAASLAAYRSDPEVSRYQGYESCTESEAEALIADWAAGAPGTPGQWFQFGVTRAGSDELIGDCALRCDESEPRLAELGFSFARAFQGKGLASAAVRIVLGYAFGSLGLHRVHAITDERNASARRLLERVGFRQEASFVENAWFKGEWSSETVYAYLRDDWAPR